MSSDSPTPNPSSPRHRRWFKRAVISFLVVANLAVGLIYLQIRNVENVIQTSASTIPDVVADLTPTTPEQNDPVTFLVIGSDSREGLDDLQFFGRFEGQRADVIMLIQIHPEDGRAQILSLPRDLWVSIPGHGENRINAAYGIGQASLMVRTVKEVTGVAVNHYVEVDFVGFKAIVDELGGVVIDFPYPARDNKSGLSVQAGRQTLNGTQALAYARSRSYQELRNGKWISVDANDIGRTQRQQQLIFAILRRLARPSTLTEAVPIVESFAKHLSMDAALAESSLVRLAFSMRGVSAEKIEAATLPTTGATINEMSVLRSKEPEATDLLARFAAGRILTEAVLEGPATLVVLNGNGVAGSAGTWSEVLEGKGYEIARVGDADRNDFPETTVLVRPADINVGQEIVSALGFGTVDVGNLDVGVDALVVVGQDAAATG